MMIEAKTIALVMVLLNPVRHYFQWGYPVEVTLDRHAITQTLEKEGAALSLMMLAPDGTVEAIANLPAGKETVNLTALFPRRLPPHRPEWLWDARTHYLQLVADKKPIGSPLVVSPALKPGSRFPHVFPDALRIDAEQHVVLHTDQGEITIALSPEAAPNTALNFKRLVADGFYSNIKIHRIMPGFVVQLGDPVGDGAGSPGYFIDLEPSAKPHTKGTVSMARMGNDPNTNGSQIFICLSRDRCAALDGKYTAFGDVIAGWDTVEKIAAMEADPQSGRPKTPPMVLRAELVAAPPRVGK